MIRQKKVWGSWILSDETSNSLKKEHIDYIEDSCDKKYLFIIEDIKLKAIHEACGELQVVDCLMSDYLPFDSFISRKNDSSFVYINKESIKNDLVQQLIKNIRGKSENVAEVIELVSNTSDDILTNVLSDVWCQVTIEGERKTFIKLISACALSSHMFCKEILLTQLKGEHTFYNTMEIVYSVSHWLESQLIVDTLLPLLKIPSSPLVNEELHLKRCIESCSNNQKTELLSGYIGMIEGKLQKYHLQVLAVLLENICLRNDSFIKLVDLLSISIMDYDKDRTLGKILLLIANNVTYDSSKNVLNDFSLVCNNFKGAMRFRIKASLKKKINF